MTKRALTYGLTGQVLEFYPPEHEVVVDGAPTAAATYSIWRGTQSNDDTAAVTGTATLDSVSTTVATSAAGYSTSNRRSITLTSSTGVVVGGRYLIANTKSQREVIVPFDATTILVENDLQYDYPVGATVKGLRQYFTIDPTFIADLVNVNAGLLPPHRVRWTYVTGSTTRHAWSYFDVARQQGKHNVTTDMLRAHFPDILEHEWRAQRGQQFAAQLDAAWSRFAFDVQAAGYNLHQLRSGPEVDEIVLRAALMIIAETGVHPPGLDGEAYIIRTRDAYNGMFARMVSASLRVWYDDGNSGAINPTPTTQSFLIR